MATRLIAKSWLFFPVVLFVLIPVELTHALFNEFPGGDRVDPRRVASRSFVLPCGDAVLSACFVVFASNYVGDLFPQLGSSFAAGLGIVVTHVFFPTAVPSTGRRKSLTHPSSRVPAVKHPGNCR